MSDLSFLRFSESERKHRMIMNYSADLLSIHSPDGSFTFVSPACKEVLGYDQVDLIGKNFFALAHPDDLARINHEQCILLDSKKTCVLEYRIKKQDGSYIWIETRMKAVAEINSKKISELICVSRDVSAHKQKELQLIENEKRLFSTQAIANVGNWELDLRTNEMWASPEAYRIYGLAVSEKPLLLQDVQNAVVPAYRKLLDEALSALIKENKPYFVEFEIIRDIDHETRMILSQAAVECDQNNQQLKVVGVLRDITDLKKAQQALLSNEAKQRAMIANISDVIGIVDAKGIATYLSPNCERWFGWRAEDMEQTSVWGIVHQEDRKRIQQDFTILLKKVGATKTVEFRFQCKDGTFKMVRLTAMNLIDDPNIKGILMNYHDITEHKKVLETLIENEEKYRGVFAAVTDGLLVVDLATQKIVDANDSSLVLYGYTKEELLKLDFSEMFKGKREQNRKDGTSFPIELSTSVFEVDGKKMLLAVVKDVSYSVKSKNEILEANRLLHESQKFAHIGSYVFDFLAGIWTASPELMRIFGITDAYEKNFEGWLKIISSMDRARMNAYFAELVKTKSGFDNKYRIVKQDTEEVLWVHGLGVFEYNEFGEIVRLIGTIQDISEKISYEEKLQESISLLTTTLESTTDGILVVGKNAKITYCNKKFIQMWDMPQDIIESWNHDDTVLYLKSKVRNQELFGEVINEIYYTSDSKSFDEFELFDGRTFERYSIPQYLNGEIVGRVWSFRDISQRKLSEMKLKESEEHFRSVVEFSQDAFYRKNVEEENFDYVSPVFEKLTGYTTKEILKLNRQQLLGKIHQEDLSIVQKHYTADCFNENESISLEYRFLCKDGQYRWFADQFIYVKDEQECYIYGSMHDISERKLYEGKILFSSYHDSLTGLYNRRYLDEEMSKLNTLENLPISIIIGDMNGLKLANDTFGHNVGDEILIRCAEIIKEVSRPTDVIARWGGDEFIVLMPNTDYVEAGRIVTKINEVCANVQVHSIPVSISFGYETKTTIEENMNAVLKIAEDYMYKHKMVETTSIRGKTIDIMLNTLYEKNEREEAHSRRVSEICSLIGAALELPDNIVSKLRAIGLVHDIGKIAIHEEILNKPGRLNEIETTEMKRHSEIGYRILSSKTEMSEVADYVLMHHERLDGSGYPKGLKGDEIPLISRILGIADSYDAMTSDRCYKDAMTEKEAVYELIAQSGTLFDEKICKTFVQKVLKAKWVKS
ncbi:MAG: PAS domain S-box protein [Clostridia bacterium]